ncbi:MAG: hypothetical protein C0484_09395 [Rhodospirillum sp.]|nr:hypothetical protein [Rhodospirillum sp.]
MADDIPATLADGWTVASPESMGLDGELIRGIGPHFESWTDTNAHAVLIARHGKLVYERYFTGEDWAWGKALGRVAYDATKRHDLRSISKSITSLLVGIAVDRGWIADLDAPVFTFFPEHADLRTAEKDTITLRHLLTMSAGFAWSEDLPYQNPQNSERLMTDAPDRCRYVLEQPLVRPPGRVYIYNGGTTALLAAILHKAAGQPLDVLAQRELFDPLGIGDVEWIRYIDGTPVAASGLRPPPAAARLAEGRSARARRGTLAEQVGHLPSVDRRVDGAAHQRRRPVLLWLSMVARPFARQPRGGQVDLRRRLWRPAALHRPEQWAGRAHDGRALQ